MTLPFRPPLAPMLARLTRDLPIGDFTYEPKWDGFRCLAFVESARIDLRSRHDRPLGRYFPEIVAGFDAVLADRAGTQSAASFIVDGEILLATGAISGLDSGASGFAALMSRLHPAASRVEQLRGMTPARYVAFDVLADGAVDLRSQPFVARRAALERLLTPADRVITATPATRDPAVADRWLESADASIDGVVAKPDQLLYEPGRRSMIKVKRLRTADCVVAGMRATEARGVTSLLLGLYDETGALRHVGSVSQLASADRLALLRDLIPLAIALADHPWRDGFTISASPLGRLPGSAARWTPDMTHDWLPLRPVRVVEVGFDQVDVDRFRHPARFLRWRPDRTAASCRLEQILRHVADLPDADLVAGGRAR